VTITDPLSYRDAISWKNKDAEWRRTGEARRRRGRGVRRRPLTIVLSN
jgi:hypothetical protein